MRKLLSPLVTSSMLLVLAIAAVLILFPQTWKQSIFPSLSQLLPASVNSFMEQNGLTNNACDSLENNLRSFTDYLQANADVVEVKGMNGLEEQLANIQARLNNLPSDVRNSVCEQEYANLEGLKSVFSLGYRS
ncbi:hypothetical protein GKR48_09525 [Providencia sp. wls1943]|jgi:hypothetical protein|uniref:Uncharacterized protein n=1 Tax=Providencia zhijiangensis TaxID=3053982 RepID=A0ABZ0N717_9GAMM|nr:MULTISPECIES: hypothetical protein [Providencia]MTC75476.1 hypothetical protein [Providencia sp. wls1919]MTB67062.1 hypothetical protein [Providencia sp. wls1943]MTC72011.1 hypothetical protein [Providencia sp. wls1914]QLR06290.1 hypothetical protein H0913_08135 [Providencia rettgeri]WPA93479.1 hypothetical protein QS795_006865 [Providencia sp. D4759]